MDPNDDARGPNEEPAEQAEDGTGPRRRGRPEGISITEDEKRLLIAAIEAGATDHAAASAAGIASRTFRDWRAAVEGRHPTRRATPEMIELFRQVDEASARARIAREIEVADNHARHWLRYRARSKPGLDGWTEPVPEAPEEEEATAPYAPTPEELAETVRVLAEAMGIAQGPRAPEPQGEEPDLSGPEPEGTDAA